MVQKEVIQFQSEDIDMKVLLMKYLRYLYLFAAGVIICLGFAPDYTGRRSRKNNDKEEFE